MRDRKIIGKTMRAVKSWNTSPEISFRRELWRRGVRYRITAGDLPGKPDVVLRKYQTAVFVDGDFWHGIQWKQRGFKRLEDQFKKSGNKKYWVKKIKRNVERDRRVNAELRAKGWRVMRFWESNIKRDVHHCVENLLKKLTKA